MCSESQQTTQILLSLKGSPAWGLGTSTRPEATLLGGLWDLCLPSRSKCRKLADKVRLYPTPPLCAAALS